MGGKTSTRWNGYEAKKKAEHYLRLDIADLNKREVFRRTEASGQLIWNDPRTGKPLLTILYMFTGTPYATLNIRGMEANSKNVYEYGIHLSSMRPHYGGKRFWFSCPECGGNARHLYFCAPRLVCRGCLDLVYSSQFEGHIVRLMRKADKLERELKTNSRPTRYGLLKPKGMHHRTFEHKSALLEHIRVRSMGAYLADVYYRRDQKLKKLPPEEQELLYEGCFCPIPYEGQRQR